MIKTGVIVGRFQTPFLHEAHKTLIETVIKKSDHVIVLLGLSPIKGSDRNPLDYQTRVEMIRSDYPQVTIGYIKDCRSDKVWSKNLDTVISDLAKPGNITLYGSRDSFIPFYSGKFETKELDSDKIISATSLRDDAKRKVISSPDFRAGVVYGTADKYPTVYTTVDIAIFDSPEKKKILLGKKKGENSYRFIGGFSEPTSDSFEVDARREVFEEANININSIQYLGSFKVNDWRYKNESSKIKTIFFSAIYESGRVQAGDDIDEVKWFNLSELSTKDVIEEHHELLQTLLENK